MLTDWKTRHLSFKTTLDVSVILTRPAAAPCPPPPAMSASDDKSEVSPQGSVPGQKASMFFCHVSTLSSPAGEVGRAVNGGLHKDSLYSHTEAAALLPN